MRVSFAPFGWEEASLLSAATDINFRGVNFADGNWMCVSVSREAHVALLVACEFKNAWDAHVNVALFDRRCLVRGLLQMLFATVFMRARRISAHVDPENSRARDAMERMGFVREGYAKLMIEGTRDAVLYGMTAEDCRYLHAIPADFLFLKEPGNGLVAKSA